MPIVGYSRSFGAAPATYRYFRLDTTKTRDVTSEIAVGELKIFVATTDHPASTMTSNTAPSPLVASAISEDNASRAAWKAFNDGSDLWGSAFGDVPGWLEIDLGSGNEIAPDSIKITAGDGGKEAHAPRDFTFEGSTTGSFSGEEDVLLTKTDETGWTSGEERTFTF